MKKHVADLDHSKALFDAGIEVGSYFQWCWYEKSPITGNPTTPLVTDEKFNLKGVSHIHAPLPCELMEILKPYNIGYRWNLVEEFECMLTLPNAINCYETYALKPANALCDMILWLKAEGLLEQPYRTEAEG